MISDLHVLNVGDTLQPMILPALTRLMLARFAGAIDDYNPMQLDERVAQAQGKNSVFASGDFIVAHVMHLLQKNLMNYTFKRYGLRMLRLLWPGDVLTCRAVVVAVENINHHFEITFDVWADNQRGECIAKGRAVVFKN